MSEIALNVGRSEDQVADAQARIDELTRLQTEDPARYTSKKVQDERNALVDMQDGTVIHFYFSVLYA